ncbi:MAG: hypothetical protein ABIS14_14715 [Sphingomonas sp.]
MANRLPRKSPLGGGILFVIGAIGGSVIGLYRGSPTLGFLAGVGIATSISLLLWARDHRST